jgi:hypothetical protein
LGCRAHRQESRRRQILSISQGVRNLHFSSSS